VLGVSARRLFLVTFPLLLMITTIFLYFLASSERMEKLASRICRWSVLARIFKRERLERAQKSLTDELGRMHEGLSVLFRARPQVISGVSLCLVLAWLSLFAVAPLLLRGLGVSTNPFQVIFLQFILYFLVPLSPTPGGSGAAELGFAALLVSVIPPHFLAIFILLWRFFTYHLILMAGGVALAMSLKK